jgi:hypothetical protein
MREKCRYPRQLTHKHSFDILDIGKAVCIVAKIGTFGKRLERFAINEIGSGRHVHTAQIQTQYFHAYNLGRGLISQLCE